MYNFNELTTNSNREKTDFPVGLAVDNVVLREISKNEKILGIQFSFQRAEGSSISFLNDTLIPPNKSWYVNDKVFQDKILTAEEHYNMDVRIWLGYVRHILVAAGIDSEHFANITGNTLEELIDNIIHTINPLLNKSNTFYLKTTKNKSGYTSLPKYRGTGVAQATHLGYPDNFKYSDYEKQMIENSEKSGIQDNREESSEFEFPPKSSTNSGLDF